MVDSTGSPTRDSLGATTRERSAPRTAAVIGSGVSGLVAALTLSATHQVTVFEAADRLGGHAHTHEICDAVGQHPLPVDTGFIVLNDRTYPVLTGVFERLGVQIRRTEMSMSVRDESSGVEYAGGRGLTGFVARPSQLFRADYLSMLTEVKRFHRVASTYLDESAPDDLTTYGDLLTQGGFKDSFLRLYAVPLVACVWSTGTDEALEYPARYLLQFLRHHGMLSVGNSPQWYTVAGGSRTYVQAIADHLHHVKVNTPVLSVIDDGDHGVRVRTQAEEVTFDDVVIATHPHQALRMLPRATPAQREVLGALRYTPNHVQLHRDASLMPKSSGARSSWNYLVHEHSTAPIVTYWMNRLQHLPASHPAYVTLNGAHRVDPRLVLADMEYEHPVYTPHSVQAQRRLDEIHSAHLSFAGAYHGWGFHEDGARSGVAAAQRLGATV